MKNKDLCNSVNVYGTIHDLQSKKLTLNFLGYIFYHVTGKFELVLSVKYTDLMLYIQQYEFFLCIC